MMKAHQGCKQYYIHLQFQLIAQLMPYLLKLALCRFQGKDYQGIFCLRELFLTFKTHTECYLYRLHQPHSCSVSSCKHKFGS